MELASIHGVHPDYSITPVDAAVGARLLRCFTSDIVAVGPMKSWNPFKKNFRHGPAQRLLCFYPRGHMNFSMGIANEGTVIIDGWYFGVPRERWREGFDLLTSLEKRQG